MTSGLEIARHGESREAGVPGNAPFDTDRLDALMQEHGVGVLVATSKANVRYLVGSYSRFFEAFDEIGTDRFLPVAGYVRSRPDQAFAIASAIDRQQFSVEPPWMADCVCECETAAESAEVLARMLKARGLESATLAIEQSFMPLRAAAIVTNQLPHLHITEAGPILEELRAVKRRDELELLRAASDAVLASFEAAVRVSPPEATTADIARAVAVEEVSRGLVFAYCLIAAGANLERTPRPRCDGDAAKCSRSIRVGRSPATSGMSAAWPSAGSPTQS